MLNCTERSMRDAVNENNLIRFCQELVRIPTVNPYSGDKNPSGESEGLAYIADYCRRYGAEIIRIPCDDACCDRRDLLCPRGRRNEGRENVVAKFVFGSGQGPTLMLDAHMDTVAADSYAGAPFSGELKDGFIHGRGSSDDKSSVSVLMEVIRILCEDGREELDGTLYCCFVTEEECDGSGRGSMACIDALPRPDAAIVLDGAFGTVLSGASGILTVRIEVPGKSGHAAYGAVSAIDQALKLAPAFAKFKSLRPAEPGMLNWGVFQSGNHPANVPELAVLGLNLRTLPADADASEAKYGVRSARIVRELFESCVAEAAANDPFLRDNPPKIIWVKDLPGEDCSPWAQDYLQFVRDAWSDALEKTPPMSLLCGWGDLTHFIRAGIPSAGMGASFPGAPHSAGEKVQVCDLVNAARAAVVCTARFLEKK